MDGINAALARNREQNRCCWLHLSSASFSRSLCWWPRSEALRRGSVGEDVQTNGLAVDEDGVLCVNSRTTSFYARPGRCRHHVFAPPRKSTALLGTDVVNVTLLLGVQVDANAIFFTALQHVPAVVGLSCVPFKPCMDIQIRMGSKPSCVIG